MIDFALSDEERLAQKTARDFAARRLAPHVRAHEREGVPNDVAREAADLGLFEASGLVRALVLEELAAADVAATIAIDAGGPARCVLGAVGQDFEGRTALVVDPAWVLPAPADVYVAVAREGVFLSHEAIVERTPSIAFNSVGCGSVKLRSERAIPADTKAVTRGLSEARIHHAALLLGLARASWEHASRYARDRVTFGRRLVDHQAAAFMLVEMAMAVDVARLAVWRAATDSDGWHARAALDEARDAALMCTERAVQLLGGHGYLEDHPVEKWMREARALSLVWR